ncbi:MAG: MFS transporter [Bacillota bacterium]
MKWVKTEGKIVITGILMMLVMGSVYSYSVFRLPIENYYDVSTSQSGIPYMLCLFFYAIFMGISGKLLQKTSMYKIMLIGIFFIVLGWLVAYLGKSFIILSIGYGVFIGIGVGMLYGIPLMVITKKFTKQKGLYLGLVLLGFGLSPFITAPIMQRLIEKVGLHQSFLIMGLFSFVILFSLSFFYKFSINIEDQFNKTKLKFLLKKKEYQLLYILFFIGTFIGLSVIGLSATYAFKVLDINLEQAALFVSLFAVFNGLGRVVFGYLSDLLLFVDMMFLSYISLATSTGLILIFSNNVIVFVIAFSVIWMNLGGWLALAPLATANLFGQAEYSRNYGVLFSAYGISALLGVYISGILIDNFGGYQSSFIMFFLMSIFGVILTFVFNNKIKIIQLK